MTQPDLFDLAERQWNPRFGAYACWQQRTHDQALAFCRERYPGGVMEGFMVWMSHRWAEWRRLRGMRHDDILSNEQVDDFDAWLVQYPPLPVSCADGQHAPIDGSCPTCDGYRPSVESPW